MMTTPQDEKRKNQPRRFRTWWLVVAFALGVLLTLVVINLPTGSQPFTFYVGGERDLFMTATARVDQATQSAPSLSDGDGFMITATAIVEQATQTAAASR